MILVNTGSANAFRQQAITWTNVDPDLCCQMASLGLNELKIHLYDPSTSKDDNDDFQNQQ